MKWQSIKQLIDREIKAFFVLKQTERLWHIPLLATVCVGVPILTGLYLGNLELGLIACLAGMVILYLPSSASLANRMMVLLVCSFGFMISYTVGISFSFNAYVSAVVFGLFSMVVHWINAYFKTKPPGSFFFIMIVAMASCMPFNLYTIPEKVGLMGLGSMFACTLGLFYSMMIKNRYSQKKPRTISSVLAKHKYANFVEAFIMGLFMFGSLLLGHLLELKNPYWIPISCAAVMQGASVYHIWQRVFHRVLGTFIGLGLCWVMLSISKTPLSICINIIVLQFIIEMLVVRHYALAVIFITPMTVLLTEAANPLIQDPNLLAYVRFWDIALGSMIGAIGGWVIHHEKIRYYAVQRIRKTRVIYKRR